MNAVLVIKPGLLCDGLYALLFSIPEVQLVVHANDKKSVLDFCQKNQDALMIIEIPADESSLLDTIPEVKIRCPHVGVVALVHTESDKCAAQEAGADLVTNVGTRASELKTMIESLIQASEDVTQ